MRQPRGVSCHRCAPDIWPRTPNMTGDFGIDNAAISSTNRSMPDKLAMYTRTEHSSVRTGYSGYSNYGGDD